MYSLFSRSISKNHNPLTDFSKLYKSVFKPSNSKVALTLKKYISAPISITAKNIVHKPELSKTVLANDSKLLSKKCSFQVMKRCLAPDTKEIVQILMFSTSCSNHFYSTTINQGKKSGKSPKAVDVYKKALEDVMQIKFQKKRIDKPFENVDYKLKPYKVAAVRNPDHKNLAKIQAGLDPEEKYKQRPIVKTAEPESLSEDNKKRGTVEVKIAHPYHGKQYKVVYPVYRIKDNISVGGTPIQEGIYRGHQHKDTVQVDYGKGTEKEHELSGRSLMDGKEHHKKYAEEESHSKPLILQSKGIEEADKSYPQMKFDSTGDMQLLEKKGNKMEEANTSRANDKNVEEDKTYSKPQLLQNKGIDEADKSTSGFQIDEQVEFYSTEDIQLLDKKGNKMEEANTSRANDKNVEEDESYSKPLILLKYKDMGEADLRFQMDKQVKLDSTEDIQLLEKQGDKMEEANTSRANDIHVEEDESYSKPQIFQYKGIEEADKRYTRFQMYMQVKIDSTKDTEMGTNAETKHLDSYKLIPNRDVTTYSSQSSGHQHAYDEKAESPDAIQKFKHYKKIHQFSHEDEPQAFNSKLAALDEESTSSSQTKKLLAIPADEINEDVERNVIEDVTRQADSQFEANSSEQKQKILNYIKQLEDIQDQLSMSKTMKESSRLEEQIDENNVTACNDSLEDFRLINDPIQEKTKNMSPLNASQENLINKVKTPIKPAKLIFKLKKKTQSPTIKKITLDLAKPQKPVEARKNIQSILTRYVRSDKPQIQSKTQYKGKDDTKRVTITKTTKNPLAIDYVSQIQSILKPANLYIEKLKDADEEQIKFLKSSIDDLQRKITENLNQLRSRLPKEELSELEMPHETTNDIIGEDAKKVENANADPLKTQATDNTETSILKSNQNVRIEQMKDSLESSIKNDYQKTFGDTFHHTTTNDSKKEASAVKEDILNILPEKHKILDKETVDEQLDQQNDPSMELKKEDNHTEYEESKYADDKSEQMKTDETNIDEYKGKTSQALYLIHLEKDLRRPVVLKQMSIILETTSKDPKSFETDSNKTENKSVELPTDENVSTEKSSLQLQESEEVDSTNELKSLPKKSWMFCKENFSKEVVAKSGSMSSENQFAHLPRKQIAKNFSSNKSVDGSNKENDIFNNKSNIPNATENPSEVDNIDKPSIVAKEDDAVTEKEHVNLDEQSAPMNLKEKMMSEINKDGDMVSEASKKQDSSAESANFSEKTTGPILNQEQKSESGTAKKAADEGKSTTLGTQDPKKKRLNQPFPPQKPPPKKDEENKKKAPSIPKKGIILPPKQSTDTTKVNIGSTEGPKSKPLNFWKEPPKEPNTKASCSNKPQIEAKGPSNETVILDKGCDLKKLITMEDGNLQNRLKYIIAMIEELDIKYKDGSDPDLIKQAKEMDEADKKGNSGTSSGNGSSFNESKPTNPLDKPDTSKKFFIKDPNELCNVKCVPVEVSGQEPDFPDKQLPLSIRDYLTPLLRKIIKYKKRRCMGLDSYGNIKKESAIPKPPLKQNHSETSLMHSSELGDGLLKTTKKLEKINETLNLFQLSAIPNIEEEPNLPQTGNVVCSKKIKEHQGVFLEGVKPEVDSNVKDNKIILQEKITKSNSILEDAVDVNEINKFSDISRRLDLPEQEFPGSGQTLSKCLSRWRRERKIALKKDKIAELPARSSEVCFQRKSKYKNYKSKICKTTKSSTLQKNRNELKINRSNFLIKYLYEKSKRKVVGLEQEIDYKNLILSKCSLKQIKKLIKSVTVVEKKKPALNFFLESPLKPKPPSLVATRFEGLFGLDKKPSIKMKDDLEKQTDRSLLQYDSNMAKWQEKLISFVQQVKTNSNIPFSIPPLNENKNVLNLNNSELGNILSKSKKIYVVEECCENNCLEKVPPLQIDPNENSVQVYLQADPENVKIKQEKAVSKLYERFKTQEVILNNTLKSFIDTVWDSLAECKKSTQILASQMKAEATTNESQKKNASEKGSNITEDGGIKKQSVDSDSPLDQNEKFIDRNLHFESESIRKDAEEMKSDKDKDEHKPLRKSLPDKGKSISNIKLEESKEFCNAQKDRKKAPITVKEDGKKEPVLTVSFSKDSKGSGKDRGKKSRRRPRRVATKSRIIRKFKRKPLPKRRRAKRRNIILFLLKDHLKNKASWGTGFQNEPMTPKQKVDSAVNKYKFKIPTEVSNDFNTIPSADLEMHRRKRTKEQLALTFQKNLQKKMSFNSKVITPEKGKSVTEREDESEIKSVSKSAKIDKITKASKHQGTTMTSKKFSTGKKLEKNILEKGRNDDINTKSLMDWTASRPVEANLYKNLMDNIAKRTKKLPSIVLDMIKDGLKHGEYSSSQELSSPRSCTKKYVSEACKQPNLVISVNPKRTTNISAVKHTKSCNSPKNATTKRTTTTSQNVSNNKSSGTPKNAANTKKTTNLSSGLNTRSCSAPKSANCKRTTNSSSVSDNRSCGRSSAVNPKKATVTLPTVSTSESFIAINDNGEKITASTSVEQVSNRKIPKSKKPSANNCKSVSKKDKILSLADIKKQKELEKYELERIERERRIAALKEIVPLVIEDVACPNRNAIKDTRPNLEPMSYNVMAQIIEIIHKHSEALLAANRNLRKMIFGPAQQNNRPEAAEKPKLQSKVLNQKTTLKKNVNKSQVKKILNSDGDKKICKSPKMPVIIDKRISCNFKNEDITSTNRSTDEKFMNVRKYSGTNQLPLNETLTVTYFNHNVAPQSEIYILPNFEITREQEFESFNSNLYLLEHVTENADEKLKKHYNQKRDENESQKKPSNKNLFDEKTNKSSNDAGLKKDNAYLTRILNNWIEHRTDLFKDKQDLK